MSNKPWSLPQSTKTNTRSGTPISPNWDPAWAAVVEAAEVKLSRRICGARTIDGGPCTLFSDHPSGRCRFHGGHHLIGAPEGNHNALLHGIFVRRLQDCGPHCPRFERRPIAGSDVAELPGTDRPACPYESVEYDASVEDLKSRLDRTTEGDGYGGQYAHHVALLQVMVGRAARALASSNDRATLEAYLRVSAEYRRALRLTQPRNASATAPKAEPKEIGIADQLRPLLKRADGVLEEAIAYERKKEARRAERAAQRAAAQALPIEVESF